MLPLKPYQRLGADWLAARSHAFLGDDTGLGKSAQALRAASEAGMQRVLILCPAIGRVSWQIEAPKWMPGVPVHVLGLQKANRIPLGRVVVVVTYDQCSRAPSLIRLRKALKETQPFDLLILDEAHYLKTRDSNRTEAVYGRTKDQKAKAIARGIPRVWALSATPQKNHAGDLYPHLDALFPQVLAGLDIKSEVQFIEKFCNFHDGDYGRVITGNNRNTIPLLREALRPFFLVRRKRDVAPELGSINRILLPMQVDPRALVKGGFDQGAEQDLDTYMSALDAGSVALQRARPANVSEAWALLGMAKVPFAIEWIKDFLEADDARKLGVIAWHTPVIQALASAMGDMGVTLHGGTPEVARNDAVRRFQEDPRVRVFIGQTIAAGTSITLTAAHNVLMLEQSWSEADDYQALSRYHRIGQTEPVTAFYAHAHGTVDTRIAARALAKARDFEELIGGLAVKPQEQTK